MEELDTLYPPYSDLDLSFTSCASITTTTTDHTRSARSSFACSSHTLSSNDRPSSTSTTNNPSTEIPNLHRHPHRKHNPNWSAIKAATTLYSDGALHLRHLKPHRLEGSGNLGRVFLYRFRDYDHGNFALKVIDWDSLTSKKTLMFKQRVISSPR